MDQNIEAKNKFLDELKLPRNVTSKQLEDSVFFPPDMMEEICKEYGFKCAGIIICLFETSSHLKITKKEWEYLYKKGLAVPYKFSEEEVISILSKKSKCYVITLGFGIKNNCDWCHSETYILHKHHYPVRRKRGGQKVVKICPSCHYEFHFLADKIFYRPIKKIESLIEKSSQHKGKFIKTLRGFEGEE